MSFNKNYDSLFSDKSFKSSYLDSNNSYSTIKSKTFIFHKIIDCVNLSMLILIFLLSFISFNSQRKWTDFYSMIINIRTANNNLIDYISTTEEFYIQKFDQIDDLRKTTSKDLIYLFNKDKKEKVKRFSKYFLILRKGIHAGEYQRGNL
tara:strand:+ start:350 stop:796 length:447 start_codon:yes stop_codon:yes gene_type:complete